jgi:hypothetical protein
MTINRQNSGPNRLWRRLRHHTTQGMAKALHVIVKIRIWADRNSVAKCQRSQRLGEVLILRHIRALDEHRNHRNVALKCCANLDMYVVIRIVNPTTGRLHGRHLAFPLCFEPLVADDCK